MDEWDCPQYVGQAQGRMGLGNRAIENSLLLCSKRIPKIPAQNARWSASCIALTVNPPLKAADAASRRHVWRIVSVYRRIYGARNASAGPQSRRGTSRNVWKTPSPHKKSSAWAKKIVSGGEKNRPRGEISGRAGKIFAPPGKNSGRTKKNFGPRRVRVRGGVLIEC